MRILVEIAKFELPETSRSSTEDDYVVLTRLIEDTEKSLDLIVPDETSMRLFQKHNVFAALSSVSRSRDVSIRIVCVFGKDSQRTIREFHPSIVFKSIWPKPEWSVPSRVIAIRDGKEVVIFGSLRQDEAEQGDGRGVPRMNVPMTEQFDVSTHPMFVWAWSQVFDGLLKQRDQLDNFLSERRYAGFLFDALSHSMGNYNQIVLFNLECAQDQLAHLPHPDGARIEVAREAIDTARQALELNLALVSDLRLLGILHNEKVTLAPADLVSAILGSVEKLNSDRAFSHSKAIRRVELNLRLDARVREKRPWVVVDELFPTLFYKLFSDAVRQSDVSSVPVEISVFDRSIGGSAYVEVLVSYHGPATSDVIKGLVPGQTPDSTYYGDLCLAIVQYMVKRYDGELWTDFDSSSQMVVFGMLLRAAPAA